MSVKISIRLPDSLHRKLADEAELKNQTFTNVVVKTLKGEPVEKIRLKPKPNKKGSNK